MDVAGIGIASEIQSTAQSVVMAPVQATAAGCSKPRRQKKHAAAAPMATSRNSVPLFENIPEMVLVRLSRFRCRRHSNARRVPVAQKMRHGSRC
jgi:hypothetical protein